MEEHFNENYIESDKYRKAILKGKLVDFDVKNVTDKPKEYKLNGSLELHGVKKNINIKVFVSKNNTGSIFINSDFILNASDFDITIPDFVKSKLTDIIKVKAEFTVI